MSTNRHVFAVQRGMILSGPAMLALWLVGFIVLARFIPIPSPGLTPDQVAALYSGRTTAIRLGLWMTVTGSALLIPFAAAISAQLRRIEGERAMLSATQFGSAAVLTLEFILPVMIWQTAAYRPDQAVARMMQMLNDMGWLMFVGIYSSVAVQMAAIGIAVLLDDRSAPILPRWYGYLSLWEALLLCPAGLVPFFKDGPFAWNGLFAVYIPIVTFGMWMLATTKVLLSATTREARQSPRPPDSSSPAVARAPVGP